MIESATTKLCLLVCSVIALIALGFGSAWHIQGLRLEKAKTDHKAFVDSVAAEGKAAKAIAEAKINEDKRKKKEIDDEYETRITSLTADIKRMRNARAGSSFVPTVASATGSAETACFDRTKLERAIRDFDSGIQDLVDEGSQSTVKLDSAKKWAAGVR